MSNQNNNRPKVAAFVCNGCSYAEANAAGTSKLQYDDNVRITRLSCTGRIDPLFVVKAFEHGADGVLVSGCHPGDCHYLEGNMRAKARADAIDLMLEDFGIEPERFRLEWVSASEAPRFAQVVTEMVEQVRKVGPSPYRVAV